MSVDPRAYLDPNRHTAAATDAIRAVDPDSIRERNDWPLYERILKSIGLHRGEQLLDAGCSKGLICAMAIGLGAKVVGVDPSPLHVTTARRRNPHGEFHVGRLEELPFPDSRFDAITVVDSLQRTMHPTRVLRELRRVLRGSGRIAIVAWSDPRGCDSAICFEGVRPEDDKALTASTGPYAFAATGAIAECLSRAGLRASSSEHMSFTHAYADLRAARHELVGGGHAPEAWRSLSEEAQLIRLQPLLEPYKIADGSYVLHNSFRLVIAKKSSD
jgi:ubiquinone/menaquinone biosynthesis C-methylase UbiE